MRHIANQNLDPSLNMKYMVSFNTWATGSLRRLINGLKLPKMIAELCNNTIIDLNFIVVVHREGVNLNFIQIQTKGSVMVNYKQRKSKKSSQARNDPIEHYKHAVHSVLHGCRNKIRIRRRLVTCILFMTIKNISNNEHLI